MHADTLQLQPLLASFFWTRGRFRCTCGMHCKHNIHHWPGGSFDVLIPYAWWFNLSLQWLASWFREDVYKKSGLYGPKSLALVQVLWSCGKLRCLQSHRHHERICADVVYIWLWSFAANPQILIDKKKHVFWILLGHGTNFYSITVYTQCPSKCI